MHAEDDIDEDETCPFFLRLEVVRGSMKRCVQPITSETSLEQVEAAIRNCTTRDT